MNLDPPLTTGERMLVHRKRLGISQAEAARRACTYRMQYSRWENDAQKGAPLTPNVKLELTEILMLQRRRSGMTQRQLGNAVGCSRQHVVEMEAGRAPADKLITYWSVVSAASRRRRGA